MGKKDSNTEKQDKAQLLSVALGLLCAAMWLVALESKGEFSILGYLWKTAASTFGLFIPFALGTSVAMTASKEESLTKKIFVIVCGIGFNMAVLWYIFWR